VKHGPRRYRRARLDPSIHRLARRSRSLCPLPPESCSSGASSVLRVSSSNSSATASSLAAHSSRSAAETTSLCSMIGVVLFLFQRIFLTVSTPFSKTLNHHSPWIRWCRSSATALYSSAQIEPRRVSEDQRLPLTIGRPDFYCFRGHRSVSVIEQSWCLCHLPRAPC